MADLTWGAWHYTGGNGMRVGLQVYGGTGVTTGSTTWSFSVDIWTGNQYNYNDNMQLNYSGSMSGTFAFNNTQGSGTSTKRDTKSVTYTYPANSYGTSPGNLTVGASISGAYNGSTPSHSTSVAVPARPYAAPNAPTSVVATRNSDTKTTVTYNGTATAQRPITSYTVQMRTLTGSTWSAWTSVYTGTAKSYAATTGVNHSYQFQVRTNNSVGSSGFVAASPQIYTTPSAPTNVAAEINGSNIDVTWNSGAYISSLTTHKIERSVDMGAWTSVASGIPQGTLTWTDTSPGGSNRYRVATVNSSHGGLSSSWVMANEVVTADCWVWDGADEIPANLTVWNGSEEVPLSIDSVFSR